MPKLAEVFPTKEAFIDAATAQGVDASNCMLVAAFAKTSFVGYMGDERLTDFEGVGTVNSDDTEGGYRRTTDYSCVACGQCVAIRDVGEYASVLTSGDLVCKPIEVKAAEIERDRSPLGSL